MKKCLLSILLATVLLCACAQQADNPLQTPEDSTLVELTVSTEETAIETPAPIVTESPAPAPTQTPKPAATPAPTEIPTPEPTAVPTEAPPAEPAAAESQPAQVSMSYGAVPFDLAAGSEEWWSIDSSDSAYWAVQENINAMRAAAGLSPLTMDSGLSAAADARCESFVAGGPFDHSGMTTRSEICAGRSDWLCQQRLYLLAGQSCSLCQYYGAQLHQHGRGLLVLQHHRGPVYLLDRNLSVIGEWI